MGPEGVEGVTMRGIPGKVVVVTGGSRGIGKAIALAFGREGARVVVCYREQEGLAHDVVRELTNQGGTGLAVRLEVTDRESIRTALRSVIETLGTVDVLVNNAGINRPSDFDTISDEDWEAVMHVNVTGLFRVTQEFLPVMRDGGSIINISSVSGQYGGPRTTHYAASKAAIIAITENLAIFCAARGIRVNAIAPGLIQSEMAQAAQGLGVSEKILLGRQGRPDEVGSVAVFLASDEASYITAQTINVNGGLYF